MGQDPEPIAAQRIIQDFLRLAPFGQRQGQAQRRDHLAAHAVALQHPGHQVQRGDALARRLATQIGIDGRRQRLAVIAALVRLLGRLHHGPDPRQIAPIVGGVRHSHNRGEILRGQIHIVVLLRGDRPAAQFGRIGPGRGDPTAQSAGQTPRSADLSVGNKVQFSPARLGPRPLIVLGIDHPRRDRSLERLDPVDTRFQETRTGPRVESERLARRVAHADLTAVLERGLQDRPNVGAVIVLPNLGQQPPVWQRGFVGQNGAADHHQGSQGGEKTGHRAVLWTNYNPVSVSPGTRRVDPHGFGFFLQRVLRATGRADSAVTVIASHLW